LVKRANCPEVEVLVANLKSLVEVSLVTLLKLKSNKKVRLDLKIGSLQIGAA